MEGPTFFFAFIITLEGKRAFDDTASLDKNFSFS